jgi:hypothetical protein
MDKKGLKFITEGARHICFIYSHCCKFGLDGDPDLFLVRCGRIFILSPVKDTVPDYEIYENTNFS